MVKIIIMTIWSNINGIWYKPSFVAFLKYLCFRAALEKLGKPGHQAQEDDHQPVDDGQHLDDDGGRGLVGRQHGGQEKGQSQFFVTEDPIKLDRQAPPKMQLQLPA